MEDCCTQILGELSIGVDLFLDYKTSNLLTRAFLLQPCLLLINLES